MIFSHKSAPLVLKRGLGCSQTRNRHPKGTAAHVIKSQAVTEFHALRFATMLTTAEELGISRNLVCHQSGARNLNHRTNQVVEPGLFLSGHLSGNAIDDVDLE